jgi:hypothetical protein
MKLWAESMRVMLGPSCRSTALPSSGAPVLTVAYEELKADREAALRRILPFLGRQWFLILKRHSISCTHGNFHAFPVSTYILRQESVKGALPGQADGLCV